MGCGCNGRAKEAITANQIEAIVAGARYEVTTDAEPLLFDSYVEARHWQRQHGGNLRELHR